MCSHEWMDCNAIEESSAESSTQLTMCNHFFIAGKDSNCDVKVNLRFGKIKYWGSFVEI